MIDLHSHLLHGVDDGAETLEQSLALARCAVADGTRVAVLTPHIHPGRYHNTRSSLQARVDAFQAELAEREIALDLRLGGEVRLGIEAMELVQAGEVPFLGEVGGYQIMLLEFPHQAVPLGSLAFVERLLRMKIRPLIAHPERNKVFMAQPERVREFVDAGCWLQLTAGSLTGHFGAGAQAAAVKLLNEGWVQVIASDAHNLQHRPPLLSGGRAAAAAVVGDALAVQLVQHNPARILGMD